MEDYRLLIEEGQLYARDLDLDICRRLCDALAKATAERNRLHYQCKRVVECLGAHWPDLSGTAAYLHRMACETAETAGLPDPDLTPAD